MGGIKLELEHIQSNLASVLNWIRRQIPENVFTLDNLNGDEIKLFFFFFFTYGIVVFLI